MNRACMERTVIFFIFFSMILVSAFPIAVSAETRYVSDILVITMRAEEDKDSGVVQTLRSNTPLEVLEETEEYLKVRTENNQEGWVNKRYITSSIPKPMIIAELGEKINRLELNLEAIKKGKKQLENELEENRQNQGHSIGQYQSAIEQERRDAKKVNEEYKDISEKYNQLLNQSQNVTQMAQKIEKLENENSQLQDSEIKNSKTIEKLKSEKNDLFQTGIIRWFIAGAAVLLVGILLGKISRRKDYY
ncbi:MAG: TIGR04211 family SH3 domain-containing protein [Pseudomonadota bacterium]